MRRMRWMAYLWPGLPQLWSYGSWGGLALALGAAVGFDLLLLVSFGWTELMSPAVRNTLWTAFGGLWVVAAVWSAKQSRRRCAAERVDSNQDQFAEAMDCYLRGDYYQAEHLLENLLRRNQRDLDARLMLATLLRHTGRYDAATQHLDALERFEGAQKWQWEIEQEREWLAAAKKQEAAAA